MIKTWLKLIEIYMEWRKWMKISSSSNTRAQWSWRTIDSEQTKGNSSSFNGSGQMGPLEYSCSSLSLPPWTQLVSRLGLPQDNSKVQNVSLLSGPCLPCWSGCPLSGWPLLSSTDWRRSIRMLQSARNMPFQAALGAALLCHLTRFNGYLSGEIQYYWFQ